MGKNKIFNNIKQAYKKRDDKQALLKVKERIKSKKRNILPEYANIKDKNDLIELFKIKAEKVDATISVCSRKNVAKNIIKFLQKNDLPIEVSVGSLEYFNEVGLNINNKSLKVGIATNKAGKNKNIVTGINKALCGAAETASLFLASVDDNPISLAFLPENNIILCEIDDIYSYYEDCFDIIKQKYPNISPNSINIITGPSRTGDIEQTILLGAHGALRVHIILIDG